MNILSLHPMSASLQTCIRGGWRGRGSVARGRGVLRLLGRHEELPVEETWDWSSVKIEASDWSIDTYQAQSDPRQIPRWSPWGSPSRTCSSWPRLASQTERSRPEERPLSPPGPRASCPSPGHSPHSCAWCQWPRQPETMKSKVKYAFRKQNRKSWPVPAAGPSSWLPGSAWPRLGRGWACHQDPGASRPENTIVNHLFQLNHKGALTYYLAVLPWCRHSDLVMPRTFKKDQPEKKYFLEIPRLSL